MFSSPSSILIIGLFFIWLCALSFFFYRLSGHYSRLTKDITKKDLKTILEKLLQDIGKSADEIEEVNKKIEKIEEEEERNIQKVGLIRFNPFAETGGDQSFSLAALDATNSGFVISSLHSRNSTRFYAKTIKKGKAIGYELSEEEERAVKSAKQVK